jgi:hypothetical protein
VVDGRSIEERVVVVFPGALGDLLLALPALRALRRRHAGACTVYVVNERLRALVSVAGLADLTASLDAPDAAGLFGARARPSWLAGSPAVYSWLGAGDDDARRRLATAASQARFFRVERGAGSTHAAVAYARAVGAPVARRALVAGTHLCPPPSPEVERLWRGLSPPVLVVHPGAGALAKRWDGSGFAAVARAWQEHGGSVVTVLGPADGGLPPAGSGALVSEWALPDLAALLARAGWFLGNDSGVSHLAGAVGAAGIVLFGPTDPRRWRPVGTRLLPLRSAGPPHRGGITLASLPPRRVIKALLRRRFALTRGSPDIH